MVDADRLDIRKLPVWERPAVVFDLFDSLPPGGSFTVVTDHEPRGLGFRVEENRRHEFMVDPRRVSHNEWVIHITRATADPQAPGTLAVLKRTPAFSTTEQAVLSELAPQCTLQTIRRGNVLIAENTDWPYVGIVYEGVLAVGSGEDHARPRIFLEVFPYEIFGELEMFDGGPANARVSALSKIVRYLRIPRAALERAGIQDPRLLLALGRVMSQRSRDLMQTLAAQATMPIIARIARALVPFAAPEKGLAAAFAPLPNMTQAQIAATAGTVKEVAARAIADLEARSLLKRERGHIRYLDRQGLLDLMREGE